jgi:hypothetical protein
MRSWAVAVVAGFVNGIKRAGQLDDLVAYLKGSDQVIIASGR